MNISETMASIRWLMEKHLGKYENSTDIPIGSISVTDRKDHVRRPPVTTAVVLEALRLYKEGQQIKAIAKKLDSTDTTVGNIVHRRKYYSDLPHTKKDIIAYMKNKGRE
jgi:DNA-binding NarL/FixJ family response regulator